jgi:hypothetical protein
LRDAGVVIGELGECHIPYIIPILMHIISYRTHPFRAHDKDTYLLYGRI